MPEKPSTPAQPEPLRVPLVTLTACQCRWPVEENWKVVGKYLFCGLPTKSVWHVYCGDHSERAARVVWRDEDGT